MLKNHLNIDHYLRAKASKGSLIRRFITQLWDLIEVSLLHFSIFDDQNLRPMKKRIAIAALAAVVFSTTWLACTTSEKTQTTDGAGLTVPSGFSAKVLIDSIGKARHLTVSPQGD